MKYDTICQEEVDPEVGQEVLEVDLGVRVVLQEGLGVVQVPLGVTTVLLEGIEVPRQT